MQHLHFQYFLGHADRRSSKSAGKPQPPAATKSRKKRKTTAGGARGGGGVGLGGGPPSVGCCLPLFTLQSPPSPRDQCGRRYKQQLRGKRCDHHGDEHRSSSHGNKKRPIVRPEAGESPACKAARCMFVQGNLTQDELIRVIQADDRYIRKETRATIIHTDVDRITLEPLGEHQFLFVRPNGSIVRYNAESLATYFLVSGVFAEPESRLPVTEVDLARLDTQLADARIKKPSCLAAFRDNAAEYKDKALERDLVDGLDRCAGEVVEEMLAVIETVSSDHAQMQLYLELFPQFTGWFMQLLQVDAAYAKQCLEQYVSVITGPPNKPIAEKSKGVKRCVLTFLQSQQKLRAQTNPANRQC